MMTTFKWCLCQWPWIADLCKVLFGPFIIWFSLFQSIISLSQYAYIWGTITVTTISKASQTHVSPYFILFSAFYYNCNCCTIWHIKCTKQNWKKTVK